MANLVKNVLSASDVATTLHSTFATLMDEIKDDINSQS